MPHNPYWTMYWRPWRRSQGPCAWRLLAPQAVAWVACGLAFNLSWDERHALTHLAAVIWLFWLTGRVAWAAAETFERERVQGTLDLAMLVPGSKRRIIYGHWLGSLLSVADLWLLGLPVAVLGGNSIEAWLFTAAWLAFFAALALMLSAERSSARHAIFRLPMVAALMMAGIYAFIPLTLLLARELTGFDLLPLYSSLQTSMPPSPLAFIVAHDSGFSAVLVSLLWWLTAMLILELARISVTRRIVIRTAGPAESGLLPRNEPSSSPNGRPPKPNPSFVDLLLFPLRRNPFYRSYREGFVRLFPTEIAAPGSVGPPALTILVIGAHVATGGMLPGLLWLLVIPAAISTVEAFGLASRSLSAEREQGTWPLLMASGLAPSRVLAGKLATTFYALSGEWTYTLPVWLLAAAVLQSPSFLLFAALTPAAIALASITGLLVSSRPVQAGQAARPADLFAALLLLAATLGPGSIGTFLRQAWHTFVPIDAWAAVASTQATCASITDIAASALAWTLLAALAWRSARTRLRRVMEGA